MMRGVRASCAFALLAPVVAACLDFGGLSGSSDDAGSSDVDANAGDGGGASTDGNVASDAATLNDAGHFCDEHKTATFCADFDEDPDATAGFSGNTITDGGILTLDLDDGSFQSPPAALLAGNTVVLGGSAAYGSVTTYTNVTPVSTATLDFDFKPDQVPPPGVAIEAMAIVLAGPPRSALQMNLSGNTSSVGEEILEADGGKLFFQHDFPATLALNSWIHLTIVLAFDARTITVTAGSQVVIDHIPMNAAFTNGAAQLVVGAAYAPGPSSGATLHFDNVVFDLK